MVIFTLLIIERHILKIKISVVWNLRSNAWRINWITLKANWFKRRHFYEAEAYDLALEKYVKALEIKPEDQKILARIEKMPSIPG